MTANIKIAPGEYYHIYNRGAVKREIFIDQRDYLRFLFTILYCQSDLTFTNLGREVNYFVRHQMFNIDKKTIDKIVKERNISLLAYSLMPNHLHLILRCLKEGGVSRYMQRILNAHAKYFNIKYKSSGHLFQSTYRAVHVEDNNQLLHLSAYVHKHRSVWSSREDYLNENRWGKLLSRVVILKQFKSSIEYDNWLKESIAKDPEYLTDN